MEIEELLVEWQSDSMVSATMGRVMSTLLSARPRKLHDSISRLSSAPKSIPLAVSLEDSLWVLQKYVKDAAVKEESLDQVLVPMIENSLKCKDAKHQNQEIVLLNWLFQDELLFQALARNFSSILLRKDDRHIALGWCILARRLMEFEVTLKHVTTRGVKERYNAILKCICSCSTHLLSIVCNGSKLLGDFELPTRLSVAAADCVIALTVALTRKDIGSDCSEKRAKESLPLAQTLQDSSLPAAIGQRRGQTANQSSELSGNMETRVLLWGVLDELIVLVQKLIAWSRKSRSLHAKGLERVLKWLHQTKEQAGSQMTNTGILLLSSCWKHYGVLLHLEDHQISRQWLEQYLSGIQLFADNYTEEQTEKKDSGFETINFFLNCLLLLLGRFTGKQFDSAMAEYRLQISRVVTTQLYSVDVDVIDGAISIFKATLFGTDYSSSGSLRDTRQMDMALPMLLNLLDERDGIARAVVTLVAEYCSISSDSRCLEEILKRLATGNVISRRNAIDVISELIHILVDSVSVLPHSSWQSIANHLLDRLGDEEVAIRTQVVKLIPLIEPSLVLPALVRLVYSSDEKVQASASSALVGMLKFRSEAEVVCMLLDCLSSLDETVNLLKCTGNRKEGPKLDPDRVLKLIIEWSKAVEDWTSLVGPLVDKMFAEPSNATIVRFLSCISEHLAGAANIVFEQVMLHTKRNKEIDESFLSELENGTDIVGDGRLQHSLFDRLCPLLIIRLLPLSVFNDLKSSLVYGELVNQTIELEKRLFNIKEAKCIAELLLDRAFNKFEFNDVRKLSAELCGRIHPQVLLPVLSSQLEYAANASHDILKIKTCLFSICTSLVVRGRDSVFHPSMAMIRKSMETILLWPSVDGDEISKAQHGCIDCLALMLCTELQGPESRKDSASETNNGNSAACTYVIDQLTRDRNEVISSNLDVDLLEIAPPLSFRLCMANSLISACQKIPDSGRKPFVRKILPRLIHSVSIIKESEIRAACIQVLFSAVYHLKSAILPYSSELLCVSVKSLQGGFDKERMAGGKLLAALMASEESVIETISAELLEARTLLSSMSSTDPSSDLGQLCTKLLICMTSP